MTEPLQPTGWHPHPGHEPGMAVPQPKDDQFYEYTGSLEGIPPGTVLKTRSFTYRAFGVPTLLKAIQLALPVDQPDRQADRQRHLVIHPPDQKDKTKVISYQSAYDSLNQNDEPSYAISGGVTLGGLVPNVEGAVFGEFLADGYTVIVPDTEGQRADFGAGPEYGMNTLDSIRAALSSSTVGLPHDARVAMLGYSGGAIATEWAAELAPTYAPEVNARLWRGLACCTRSGGQPALRGNLAGAAELFVDGARGTPLEPIPVSASNSRGNVGEWRAEVSRRALRR